MSDGNSSRWCYRCDTWKAPSDFYSYCKYCKECKKRYVAQWTKDNAEHKRKYNQRYQAENEERVREYKRRYKERNPTKDKEYYEANKEQIKLRNREYHKKNTNKVSEQRKAAYERNRERNLERSREWKKAHPDRVRISNGNRRARLKEAGGEVDADTIYQMYEDQQGLCAYCESPLFGDFHVDHMMPLSRGGTNDWHNLAITCPSCNCSKQAKTVQEFLST